MTDLIKTALLLLEKWESYKSKTLTHAENSEELNNILLPVDTLMRQFLRDFVTLILEMGTHGTQHPQQNKSERERDQAATPF